MIASPHLCLPYRQLNETIIDVLVLLLVFVLLIIIIKKRTQCYLNADGGFRTRRYIVGKHSLIFFHLCLSLLFDRVILRASAVEPFISRHAVLNVFDYAVVVNVINTV